MEGSATRIEWRVERLRHESGRSFAGYSQMPEMRCKLVSGEGQGQ